MESSATCMHASDANSLAMPASRSLRRPASMLSAASSVSSRAARTWVAMSASRLPTDWCCQIGLPNVSRCWA